MPSNFITYLKNKSVVLFLQLCLFQNLFRKCATCRNAMVPPADVETTFIITVMLIHHRASSLAVNQERK